MKKVLITLAIVLFAAGSANAMPFALSPYNVLGGSYGQTGVYDQLGTYIQTTSTEVGGAFTDVGHLAVTSLIPTQAGQKAGLDDTWFLIGGWSDLQGTQGPLGSFTYTSGTLDLYVTTEAYGWGSSVGAGDDTGFTPNASFNHVASLSLVSGAGGLDYGTLNGWVELTWEFTAINQDGNFWLDENGQPINLANLSAGERLFAIADANTHLVEVDFTPNGAVIRSDHNGSVAIGVVPEPASMVLFGSGLFGLAGAGLRKKILG